MSPSSLDHFGEVRGRWVVLFGVWLVYCLFGVIIASLPPMAEQICTDLGLNQTQFGLAQGAWALIFTLLAIPAGAKLDRVNPAHAVLAASLVMAISCAGRALAQGPLTLMLAVAVFGLGAPLVSIGAPKLIHLCFSRPRERGLAVGIYSTAPLLGVVIAMSMTQSVFMPVFGSWRACLLAYAVVVMLCSAAWFRIQRMHFALQQFSAAHSGSVGYSRLLASREIRVVLALGAVTLVVTNGLDAWLPTTLRLRGMAPTEAGYLAALPSLCGMLAAVLLPWRAKSGGSLVAVTWLMAACSLSCAMMAWAPLPLALIALPVVGFSRSALVPLLSLFLLQSRHVGSASTGAAMGLFFAAAQMGGIAGPAGMGMIADATGDFRLSLSVVAVFCALGCLLAPLARQGGEIYPHAASGSLPYRD